MRNLNWGLIVALAVNFAIWFIIGYGVSIALR